MVLRYIPRGWPEEEVEGSQDFPNTVLWTTGSGQSWLHPQAGAHGVMEVGTAS